MKICTKCKTNPAPHYHQWCKFCKSVVVKAWRKRRPWKERYISIDVVLKMLAKKPTSEVIELLKLRINKPLPEGIRK